MEGLNCGGTPAGAGRDRSWRGYNCGGAPTGEGGRGQRAGLL